MEYHLQRTIISENQINVNGELFIEKKEHEILLKPESEDLDDMIHISHSRQIGEDKFIKISGTWIDDSIEVFDDDIEETNLETKEKVKAFKTAWESGWQPTFPQAAHDVFDPLIDIIDLIDICGYAYL